MNLRGLNINNYCFEQYSSSHRKAHVELSQTSFETAASGKSKIISLSKSIIYIMINDNINRKMTPIVVKYR